MSSSSENNMDFVSNLNVLLEKVSGDLKDEIPNTKIYKKLKVEYNDGAGTSWSNDIGNVSIHVKDLHNLDIKVVLDQSKYSLVDLLKLPGNLKL